MASDESPMAVDLAREPDFEIGGLAVHPSKREAVKDDVRETLEPRVMQALVVLAGQRNEVVSRDDLIARCWGGVIVGDDAISAAVAKVRKLGETHGAFSIETIPRVGYRLVEAGRTSVHAAPAILRRRPWRWLAVAVLAAVVAALSLGLCTLRPQPVRVAVLPLEVAPGDAAAQALASQVRDQIAGVLSARQVDVIANGSARGARLVVAGALQRTGDVAQVRVQIDDPGSHLVLWQGTFEGPAGIDSPLAQRAAAKVTDLVYADVTIIGEAKGRLEPQALRAFTLGADAARDGRSLEGAEFYRAFRDREPRLASGHAFYASVMGFAASSQPPAVAAASQAEAVRSAQEALRLNPHSAQAYWALAVLTPREQYARRVQIISEGMKNAPNYGSLNVSQGMLLAELGRPREGLPYVRRGQTLDPLSPPKQFGNAAFFGSIGLIDEARAQLNSARRIWPESPIVRSTFTDFAVEAAAPGEARQILTDLRTANPGYAQEADLWLDYVRALECKCRQAETGQVLWAAARDHRVDRTWLVPALVRLGQVDLAYEAAEQNTRSSEARMLFVDATGPMRREARFMDLAARLGLAQYWLASGRWPEFCAEPGLGYDCKVEAARAVAAQKR